MGIDVNAPAELVFGLARDPYRWPALLPHYVRARAIARDGDQVTGEFVARTPLIPVLGLSLPVAWRSRTWAEPEVLHLRFHHLAGATRGMDVTWRFEPTTRGCRVTIEHDFRPRIRLWAVVVDRWFIQPIGNRTLRTFKVLAEAIAPPPP